MVVVRDNRGDDMFKWWPSERHSKRSWCSAVWLSAERPFGGPKRSPIQQAVSGVLNRLYLGQEFRPQSDMPDMRMPANAAYISVRAIRRFRPDVSGRLRLRGT